MTIGNTWLPEDLLYAVAIASDVTSGAPPLPPDTNHLGLFGRPTGELLRTFLREGKRPLVWTDDVTGDEVVPTLLIDPYVGHIAGGRITAADVEAWEAAWAAAKAAAAEGPAEQRDRFAALVASMPAHLRLSYRSYDRRHICAAEEAAGKAVLGIDGMGACVYWEPDRAPPASWEMLNDGTCEPSYSPRPTKQYPSQAACASRPRLPRAWRTWPTAYLAHRRRPTTPPCPVARRTVRQHRHLVGAAVGMP